MAVPVVFLPCSAPSLHHLQSSAHCTEYWCLVVRNHLLWTRGGGGVMNCPPSPLPSFLRNNSSPAVKDGHAGQLGLFPHCPPGHRLFPSQPWWHRPCFNCTHGFFRSVHCVFCWIFVQLRCYTFLSICWPIQGFVISGFRDSFLCVLIT